MTPSEFLSWLDAPPRRPLVLGILNLTPDSFSDGGRHPDPASAAAFALQLAQGGADLIDIGGESTRPGSAPVPADEQLRRVIPVIELIRKQSPIALSIDTSRSSVASAALDYGVNLVNDIWAGRDDPEMLSLVARRQAAIILMHMQGSPATMQQNPTYKNVTAEVAEFLSHRRAAALNAGVKKERILLDPGIGFGKTTAHNLQLLRNTAALVALGQPLVIGASRKGFIGQLTNEPDATRRQFGSTAVAAFAVSAGASIIRAHDVRPTVQTLAMISAILAPRDAASVDD